jgi:hypothetical protein
VQNQSVVQGMIQALALTGGRSSYVIPKHSKP